MQGSARRNRVLVVGSIQSNRFAWRFLLWLLVGGGAARLAVHLVAHV
jgi:hypothetical protein